MEKLSRLKLVLIITVAICAIGTKATAKEHSLKNEELKPGEATANSAYWYKVRWKDDDNFKNLDALYLIIDADTDSQWIYTFDMSKYATANPGAGYNITVKLSRGLHTDTGECPDPDIVHCPSLFAYKGNPTAHTFKWLGIYIPPDGKPEEIVVTGSGPTVYDSFTGIQGYGGVKGSRDWLVAYPFQYPHLKPDYADPLTVLPIIEQYPDDGTANSDYIFRVHYFHTDQRVPTVWYYPDDDKEGVELYMGPADDHPSPAIDDRTRMYREDPADEDFNDIFGVVYMRYFIPTGNVLWHGNGDAHCPWVFRWYEQRTVPGPTGSPMTVYRTPDYVSLDPGRYQYFYACCDDDISQAANQSQFDQSTPYIPADSIYFQENGGVWGGHAEGFHSSVFLDRVTYFPGPGFHATLSMANGYPFPSWDSWYTADDNNTHPFVNPGLESCYENCTGSTMQDPLGNTRFLGTLYPYKYTINPLVPRQGSNGTLCMWSETSTITESGRADFRVVYRQTRDENDPSDTGWTPTGVWLCMYDDWFPTGTPTRYEMQLTSGPFDDGLDKWAVYKINLGTGTDLKPGSHSYYFEATDGKRTCQFPRRPDQMAYDGAIFDDRDCPGGIGNGYGCPEDNNVINGPYVNRKCILSDNSVNPLTGTAGTDFVFKVKYTDLDGPTVAEAPDWDPVLDGPRGQRPYLASVIIQTEEGGTLENGGALRCTMHKSDPTDTDYTDGAWYELDTSSVPGLILLKGTRHYYFEFMDDWGRPVDLNLRIAGELTTLKQGQYGFAGPVIMENTKPTLYPTNPDGSSVTSADGSCNSATDWNYHVTYKDVDNQKPTYVHLYIGKVDPVTGQLIWDTGHAMEASDPNDLVYADGKEYTFTTNLEGSEGSAIQYYYCFVASDGIDVAEYDETTSSSAHTVWDDFDPTDPVSIHTWETLTPYDTSNKIFEFAHKPIVGGIPPNITNYDDPLIYVDGLLRTTGYVFDYLEGRVSFTTAVTGVVTAKYWFGIADPSGVGGNNPPELSDRVLTPTTGSSSTLFRYTVRYKDADGISGQEPEFVNVVIDGQAHAMASTLGTGGDYKSGVRYQYETSLQTGVHSYYFEASDGADFVILDVAGCRPSDQPGSGITPITGPYVNDPPTLSNGLITPNEPGVTYSTGQYFEYSVVYTDVDNDAPNAGYPVVYIDNPDEETRDGTITSVGTTTTTITDSSQSWTVDEFDGMPVEVTTDDGRSVFMIGNNDEDTLTLITDNIVGIEVGDTFSIGKLRMQKSDPADSNYTDGVLYKANVPSLGVKLNPSNNIPIPHSAHFRSVTTNHNVGPGGLTADTSVRLPDTAPNEIVGPTISGTAPSGNIGPTLTDGGHAPTIGTIITPFVFSVTYTDANGDAPAVRGSPDNVVGYIRMVIDGTRYAMTAPTLPDYTAGAVFTYSMSGFTAGLHTYYFEASDGWVTARFPSSGSLTLSINSPPVLSEPLVTPASGNTGMSYIYSVKYTDANSNAPTSINVVIDGNETDISAFGQGSSYSAGVVYRYTLPGGSLTEGAHTYQFNAADANDIAAPTAVISGPNVYPNTPPTFSLGAVTPTSGWDTDTYTYSVKYTDLDGDAPEYVKVYIDGSAETKANVMVKDPDSDEFENGVVYTFEKEGMTVGSHTFFFKASDYVDTIRDPQTVPNTHSGPTVSNRPTAVITIDCDATPILGQPTTISGTINPPMAVGMKLRITSPSNVSVERDVTSQTNGSYSYVWTPNITGSWKLQTSWVGAGNYQSSTSDEITVVVSAAPYSVNGLDMISVPLNPSSGFPDSTFGADPKYALAKWMTAAGEYKIYSLLAGYQSDFDFPEIAAGEAYWIKTVQPKVINPSGWLVSTSTNFTRSLRTGWSQVGCPFTDEVNWSSLRIRYNVSTVDLPTAAANGWVREYGWTYDPTTGGYNLVDAVKGGSERTMLPWHGYWMKALVNCQLVIPPPGSAGASTSPEASLSSRGNAHAQAKTAKWQIQIMATNGNLKDEKNFFGLAMRDAERIECPACIESYVDLYFTDENGGIYASDLRTSLRPGDEWLVKVVTDKSGEVELTWDGLENLPGNVKLTLIDDESGKYVPITPRGSYTFNAGQGGVTKSLRILFENK